MRAALALLAALVLVPAAAGATGPVVVIDPGHDERANLETEPIGPGSATRKIKDGGGTHGVVTGTREADLVLDISLRLRALLRRAGVSVVMTRTRTAGASMGNIARARIANRGRRRALPPRPRRRPPEPARCAGRTSSSRPCGRGGRTTSTARAARAASLVLPELVRALGFPDRGITERTDFTGFNWADVPVILVELGFMTNPGEDRALARSAVRQRAALGLCRGTLRALGRAPSRCGV